MIYLALSYNLTWCGIYIYYFFCILHSLIIKNRKFILKSEPHAQTKMIQYIMLWQTTRILWCKLFIIETNFVIIRDHNSNFKRIVVDHHTERACSEIRFKISCHTTSAWKLLLLFYRCRIAGTSIGILFLLKPEV